MTIMKIEAVSSLAMWPRRPRSDRLIRHRTGDIDVDPMYLVWLTLSRCVARPWFQQKRREGLIRFGCARRERQAGVVGLGGDAARVS
jgi:hypothetical protein